MPREHDNHLYPTYCKKCGKEFYRTPEHVYKSGSKYYCSWTCFNHRKAKKPPLMRFRAVKQFTIDGEYIQTFQSANNAIELMGYQTSKGNEFRKACEEGGEYRGFIWQYADT